MCSVCILCVAVLGISAATSDSRGAVPTGDERSQIRRILGTDRFEIQSLTVPGITGEPLSVRVRLDGTERCLVLTPYEVRSPGFRVRVLDAGGMLRAFAPPAATTYRGRVVGWDASEVTASVHDGALVAVVRAGGVAWIVQPATRLLRNVAAEGHVVYRSVDSIAPNARCAVSADLDARHVMDDLYSVNPFSLASMDVLVTEIACDTDYEFFELNGSSIENTLADIESVINHVSAVYERDVQATFVITEIIVRAAADDPYDTTNPDDFLEQFRTQWMNHHEDVHRDVAHLFSGKDLDGTVIGIAWRGSLCNFLSFSLVQSLWSNDPARRAAVSAHELGHNFDSGHCDDSDWWCRIMCTGIGGCSGYHSFGPWAVTLMRDYAAKRECLDAGVVEIPTDSLPFLDGFEYSGDLDSSRWEAVDGAIISQSGGIEPSPTRSVQLNNYDSMRTVMMSVDSPATVSYWVNHRGVETNKRLRIEYFDSTAYTWRILEDVISDGVTDTDYAYYEHTVPPDGFGGFFMLRFTPWGAFCGFSDKWYVDDVSVVASSLFGDMDLDGDIDLFDFGVLAICTAGPNDVTLPTGCGDDDFVFADLDGDGDVDLGDFRLFQSVFVAAP